MPAVAQPVVVVERSARIGVAAELYRERRVGLHLAAHREERGLGRVGQLDAIRREVDLEAVRLLLVEAVRPQTGETAVHALGLLGGLVGPALGGGHPALEALDLAA